MGTTTVGRHQRTSEAVFMYLICLPLLSDQLPLWFPGWRTRVWLGSLLSPELLQNVNEKPHCSTAGSPNRGSICPWRVPSAFFFFFFFSFCFLGHTCGVWRLPGEGASWRFGGWPTRQPQQHGIWATPVTYPTTHGNAGSLTHWVRSGIERTSFWILVGFLTCWATTGTPVPLFRRLNTTFVFSIRTH